MGIDLRLTAHRQGFYTPVPCGPHFMISFNTIIYVLLLFFFMSTDRQPHFLACLKGPAPIPLLFHAP